MNPSTRNTIRPVAALSLALIAAGCARLPFTGHDDSADKSPYTLSRNSLNHKPLEIPPDLTAPDAKSTFEVPGISQKDITPAAKKALEATPVATTFTAARLESAGSERWLVVEMPVEKIWPQLRQFWLDQGFTFKEDNAVAGLLETDFHGRKLDTPDGFIRGAISRALGTNYSADIIDQYRIRLERGNIPNTSEIYISHSGMHQVQLGSESSDLRWVPLENDPELEAAMLKRLLVRIGVSTENANAIVNEGKPGDAKTVGKQPVNTGVQRVQSIMVDGSRNLQLFESFDRSWRRVGLALERAGYSVTDRDRQLGVYYVRKGKLDEIKEEKSFWSKLAFWSSDAPKIDDSKTPKGTEYVITVTSKDTDSFVKVTGKEGTKLDDKKAKTLLDALENELR